MGPLAFRHYLAPIFLGVGAHKFANFDDMVALFDNADWGLGLPMPVLMVFLAVSGELLGSVALLPGLAARLFVISLVFTMLVAMGTSHWDNGWFATAPGDSATSTANVLAAMGIPAAQRSLENSKGVGQRVSPTKRILRKHGNYSWLTEKGNLVVLNNGIEFAANCLIILLSLLFTGGGRWVSLDYWVGRRLGKEPR